MEHAHSRFMTLFIWQSHHGNYTDYLHMPADKHCRWQRSPCMLHRVVGMDGGDAESQGVPGAGGSPDLAGAAMILRDPSALYLLCHQVLQQYDVS